MQYIFRNKAEVLPPKKNKMVIRPADVSIATFSRRLGFLLQKIAHYLFSPCVPARLDDLEGLSVRRSEADLSGDLGGWLFIDGPERLVFPRHFVGARASKVLLLDSFQRLQNQVQIRRCGRFSGQ